MARGKADQWCPVCGDWQSTCHSALSCGHVLTELIEGAKHKDAAENYKAAIDGKATND
ncbi:MAG: hypothetical protein ACLP1X_07560 [Polyangiaceae bacterium]|jgi:hypothetical protein